MNHPSGLKTLRVYILVTLAMLFWGLSFVWFKLVIVQYEPITIIFLRLTASGLLIALFLGITGQLQRIKRADLKWFMLLSFTQPFCYFLGESFGLKLVSSTISSVIISTIPLFSPVAVYLLYREQVSKEVITGILFSFVGILVMLLNPDLTISASPKGILLLFVAVCSAVAYSVVIRKLAFSYNPGTIIMMQNLIGAVYFLPLFLVFDAGEFVRIKPTREVIMALIQLSFFASTLSYLFYIISIKEIGVVKANVLTNLIPIFTAVFSYLILAERFTPAKILGMIIVIAGIMVSQYRGIRRAISATGKNDTSSVQNRP